MRTHPIIKPYGSAVGRIEFIPDSQINGKTILDIGSGTGWFGIYALKKSVKKIFLIEPSREANTIAREYLKPGKCEIIEGQAYPLPFKNAFFDTIVCWEVLEHIPKSTENKLFAEVVRVLKPGGHLFLSTPYDSFVSKITDPAWWLIGHRHYSFQKLRKFGEGAGLTIIDHRIQGGWRSIVYNLDMYFSKWILRRQAIFKKYLQALSTSEYRSKSGFLTIFIHFTKGKAA